MGMFTALIDSLRTPDLRNKILFTLGMILVFRFLAHVPLPGVNQDQLTALLQNNQLINLLDLFSGGGLARFSIVALGVNPYINASIIMTLLNQTIPALERLSKEGEYGRNRINQYTRILTVPLALLQGIGVAVFMQEGQRRIPVQYAKRVRGTRMYSGGSTHIPLRVNSAGVIPIIFAISILLLPSQIAQYFTTSETQLIRDVATGIVACFQNPIFYNFTYFVLVVAFTFFYTAFTFIPNDVADNIKRYGGFIPGIRPGRPTAEFLSRVVTRITIAGALFLGIVAVMPTLVADLTGVQTLRLGGTSILIVVGVVVETMKQLEAQLLQRSYEGFIR